MIYIILITGTLLTFLYMVPKKQIVGIVCKKEICDIDIGVGCLTDYEVHIKEENSTTVKIINSKTLFDSLNEGDKIKAIKSMNKLFCIKKY